LVALHENLLRRAAYPRDRAELSETRRALRQFAGRTDVARFRDQLGNSGIAGTEIDYRFYWPTALWLARRWPSQLRIDWEQFERAEQLSNVLPLLLPFTESLLLDNGEMDEREVLNLLKGRRETDASFLIRLFADAQVPDSWRERLYEDLDIPLTLVPGRGTPSRTTALFRPSPVAYRGWPPDASRPDLLDELSRGPRGIRQADEEQAVALIDMARGAMVTRERDLDAFVNADPRDVRIVDDGDGLEFAMIGQRPDRRLMLESVYGFLILQSGIPVGYLLSGSLFGSSEVALNIFPAFRGGETARIYARCLAMLSAMFGSTAFMVPPYQMGYGNPEGLESGAWWFYYKLGFRPEDRYVKQLVRRELKRLRRKGYRSSVATLDELASEPMFWYPGGRRPDVLGRIDLGVIGERVSGYLARRFGSERSRALETCAAEVTDLLRPAAAGELAPSERLAWQRWAPLVQSLPGISRWSASEKRKLAEVVRAKGGTRESEFVRLFDGRQPLRRAILLLARG